METMFTIDTDAAVRRFMDLAAIPGKSGEEKAVMTRLIEMLSAAGVPEQNTSTPGDNSRSLLTFLATLAE